LALCFMEGSREIPTSHTQKKVMYLIAIIQNYVPFTLSLSP
jgi:hypothetical protein